MAHDRRLAAARIRFSVAGLMGAVLFAALGFAALRDASELAASAAFTLALAAMAASIPAVMASRGRRRVAWLGFAAFGWAYLIVAFNLPAVGAGTPKLLPEVLLQLLFGSFHPLGQVKMPGIVPPRPLPLSDAAAYALGQYLQVARSLGAILFAAVGALVGYAFASWCDPSEDREPDDS